MNNVSRIDVLIDWKKSRTWGWCPKAKVIIFDKDLKVIEEIEGKRANGYGYDKRGAAISSTLCESDAFLKHAAAHSDNEHTYYELNEIEKMGKVTYSKEDFWSMEVL